LAINKFVLNFLSVYARAVWRRTERLSVELRSYADEHDVRVIMLQFSVMSTITNTKTIKTNRIDKILFLKI
jgi:cob(I)alamin adenosyltransferase